MEANDGNSQTSGQFVPIRVCQYFLDREQQRMMRSSLLKVSATAMLLVTISSCGGASKDEKGISSPLMSKPSAPALISTPFSTVREWLGLISQGKIAKSLALEDGSVYGPTMVSVSLSSASQISLTSGTTPLPTPVGYKTISLVVTRFFAHLRPGQGPKDGIETLDVVVGEPLTASGHWRVLGATQVGQSRTLLRLAGEGDDHANIATAPKVTAKMITGARMALAGFLQAEKNQDLAQARSFLDARLDLKWDFAATFGAVKDFKLKDLIVGRMNSGNYWPSGWDSPPYRPGVGYQVSLPVLAAYTLQHPTIFNPTSVFTLSLRDDGKWLIVNAGSSP